MENGDWPDDSVVVLECHLLTGPRSTDQYTRTLRLDAVRVQVMRYTGIARSAKRGWRARTIECNTGASDECCV